MSSIEAIGRRRSLGMVRICVASFIARFAATRNAKSRSSWSPPSGRVIKICLSALRIAAALGVTTSHWSSDTEGKSIDQIAPLPSAGRSRTHISKSRCNESQEFAWK